MANSPKNFIHYDTERVDYAVSNGELEQMRNAASNNWKDFTIGCAGIGIPCLINALSSNVLWSTPFAPTLPFNLNLVVGILGVTLAAAFGIAWYRTGTSLADIITKIKNKPKIEFAPQMTNVGKIEE